MKKISINDLMSRFSNQIVYAKHAEGISFSKPAPLHLADNNSISFISNKKSLETLLHSDKHLLPAVLILPVSNEGRDLLDTYEGPMALIAVKNPRLFFIKVLQAFFSNNSKRGISPTAIIADDVYISESCYIGHNVVIEECCKIGENVHIGNNVTIHPNTIIGNDVVIKSNVTIGSDGFGYEKDEDNVPIQFIHYGGVEIGDNVAIGAGTCIDKGTFENTIIGSGTKIDNLVHVAHNVVIGKNCLVIAHAIICGSVKIGDNCWIAPNTSLINTISVAESTTIGLGSVVTKSIEQKESVVTGNPARPLTEVKKINRELSLLIEKNAMQQ